ncbi:universal stress protein [Haladaptatus sp. DFWS20]|uniref:universal stress protein n=1 Tax=Haladaptatus sp. DFWS20 TaxID=3403467 RepID=UPI003EB739B7
MPETVLVPLDGSPLSERALRYVIENFAEAVITTIHVINPADSLIDVEVGGLPVASDWYDRAQERADGIHASATEFAADHDFDLDTVTEIGRPARAILAYADEHDVDQIVMGSHSRSDIERAILGSVAETVTRQARVPVTIIR